ncbi:MAG: hypothetical protein O7C59_05285, partial [Rickettsia endosymbiont of Ixodes persulcatus]|nr:hypothetical protein [Rickettsia endosymbiont of Ixodes persulcatus]
SSVRYSGKALSEVSPINLSHDSASRWLNSKDFRPSGIYRELKQTCGIERCQARTGRAQRNHISLAVFAWLDMNKRMINKKITLYQQNWEVIKTSIQNNIRWLLADTQFC